MRNHHFAPPELIDLFSLQFYKHFAPPGAMIHFRFGEISL